jgi:hypothetical protein
LVAAGGAGEDEAGQVGDLGAAPAGRNEITRETAGGRSGVQAGDRLRGGEGGIAGCRVSAPAGLGELDLVRVRAADGR